jgi:hypothetical protein
MTFQAIPDRFMRTVATPEAERERRVPASSPVQEIANRTLAYPRSTVHPLSVTSEPVKTAIPATNVSIERRISSRVTGLPEGL